MKKQNILMLTATLGLTIIAPMMINADETGGEYISNGMIEFTPNTDITDPVSPLDPDPNKPIVPIDPTNPEGPNPGNNGPLSIDFASSLDFGKPVISSKNETYKAAEQAYKAKGIEEPEEPEEIQYGPNFVQVTDNRGLEEGWTLKVKQNGQFQMKKENEEAPKVLTAAAIKFKNGNIQTVAESPEPSLMQKEFTLDPAGTEQIVMSAQDGEGAGTYLMAWGDKDTAAESIELEVPGTTKKYAGKYSTSFTWILSDVPTNSID